MKRNEKNGFPGLQKANEIQHQHDHTNLIKGRQIRTAMSISSAEKRLTILLNSQEVHYLPSHGETDFTLEKVGQIFNKFAVYESPSWEILTPKVQAKYRWRISNAHQTFTKYRKLPKILIQLEARKGIESSVGMQYGTSRRHHLEGLKMVYRCLL